MTRYVVRRLIQSVFLLLGVTILSYGIMRIAPGGPSQFIGGEDNPRINPEYRRQLAESFGLHDPVPIQYAKWLWNVLHLDFGRSFADQRPVIEKIAERIPASFQLALASLVLGLLGIPLGVYAATHRGRLADQVIRLFTVAGNCVPHWWLGLMVLVVSASGISILGFQIGPLRIFPLGGQYTIGVD